MMNRRGFTLVEMMVAMIVLGIMGIALVDMFRIQHSATLRQNEGVLQTQNARAGIDMLSRELRNAGYDPRQTSGATLLRMSETDVEWTADLNADGDTNDFGGAGDERVRYYFQADSSALVREANGVTARVADGISSLSFSYFQGNGAVALVPADVEQVWIVIRYITPDGVMEGDLETQVALRNLIYQKWSEGQ